MSDTWIRIGRYAVVVVGVIVAAISYSHIRDLALNYGGDSLTAPLLPLGIDGAVAAMTVFMHQARGAALWLSRFGLLVAIGMTVAFNTAYGAAFGMTGAVVWSAPAVLLVICIEVSVLTVRRTRPVTEPEPAKPQVRAVTVSEPVAMAPVKAERLTVEADRLADAELFTLSAKALAAKRGVSQSTIQRDRRKARLAMANGNGKAH